MGSGAIRRWVSEFANPEVMWFARPDDLVWVLERPDGGAEEWSFSAYPHMGHGPLTDRDLSLISSFASSAYAMAWPLSERGKNYPTLTLRRASRPFGPAVRSPFRIGAWLCGILYSFANWIDSRKPWPSINPPDSQFGGVG